MEVYLKNAHIVVDNSPRLPNFVPKLMTRDGMLTKLYDVRFLYFAYQQCLQKHKIQMKKCRKNNYGVPTKLLIFQLLLILVFLIWYRIKVKIIVVI